MEFAPLNRNVSVCRRKIQGKEKRIPVPVPPVFLKRPCSGEKMALFLLFPGLRLYGVYPSFRTYGVYPFPLFSQEKGIHHSFFLALRPRGRATGREKRGSTVVVYTLFSPGQSNIVAPQKRQFLPPPIPHLKLTELNTISQNR